MTVSKILILLFAFLFVRCKGNNRENDFSGTYVIQTKGEYAIDCDTLVVSMDHSSANTYSVQNNSGFQKIRNGVILPKEFKKTAWVAIWDVKKHILSETDLGRQIQFRDNGKLLVLKNTTYRKIK